MKAVDLMRHVRSLSSRYAITVNYVDRLAIGQSMACASPRWARVPIITGQDTYARALHEFGHAVVSPHRVGRGQADLLHEEFAAWRWARDHALAWTPTMRRRELASLRTYIWRLEKRR